MVGARPPQLTRGAGPFLQISASSVTLQRQRSVLQLNSTRALGPGVSADPAEEARSHEVPPRFQEPLSNPRSPGSPVIYLSADLGGSHDSNLGFNDSFKGTHAQGAGRACAQGRASLRLQLGNDRGMATGKAWGGRGPGHRPWVGGPGRRNVPHRRPPRTAAPAVARRLLGALLPEFPSRFRYVHDRSSPWPLTTDHRPQRTFSGPPAPTSSELGVGCSCTLHPLLPGAVPPEGAQGPASLA